jgi:hypothetical protein
MNKVLIFAAVAEAITGLALVFVPGLVAGLLLGSDLAGSGLLVARVAGIALIALAIACWPGPASLGMLAYGLIVTLYLGWLGATKAATGPLLWPAVLLHAVLAGLLLNNVRKEMKSSPGENPSR